MKLKPPVGKHHENLQRYVGRVHAVYTGCLSVTLWPWFGIRRWRKLKDKDEGRLIPNIDREAKGVKTRGRFRRGTPIYVWTWRDQGGVERLFVQSLEDT